jgi:CheY-like chemotaxis protein
MALSDFELDGRPLQFTSAYSGSEAQQLLSERNDFALVLLDVVMETDHAGLEVARWIRETLDNRLIRIVLRTGQPGQAPEEEIIARYEIDDYKEKTELTYRKLVTLMYSSLRAYRELLRIERNRQSLEHIIRASAQLFTANSVRELSQGILQQLVSLVTHADTAAYCNVDGLTAEASGGTTFEVLAATGSYQTSIGQRLQKQVDLAIVKSLIARQDPVSFTLTGQDYYGLYRTSSGRYYLLYIEGIVKDPLNGHSQLSDNDQSLLALFMNNTAIAFEHARDEAQPAQGTPP